ncbi:hypothetical protein, partial [Catenuloplanes japonicus]|uniref:hypothetical protein n=1 Tax=Catenuloplanes japonicus TaxID=33876 RepID=UPI000524D432
MENRTSAIDAPGRTVPSGRTDSSRFTSDHEPSPCRTCVGTTVDSITSTPDGSANTCENSVRSDIT